VSSQARSGPRSKEFASATGTASPRKLPSQRRSKQTVAAILAATFRVLDEAGGDGLTTTRVAEVAGVSVGTLYQYFPHREALLHALLADHLAAAVDALEVTAQACAGLPRAEAVERVVRAFLAEKAARAANARILNKAFGADKLDDRPQVKAAVARAHRTIAKVLGGSDDPDQHAATLACAAVEGMMRSAIDEDPGRLADPVWIDQVVRIARAAASPR
jgi:AcrR family transcriptional regulator